MDDLRETTHEMERREQELREKQEQLVQAGKLATLGELTTGVAHELNNPLNNIGLFITNAIDRIELGSVEEAEIKNDLSEALDQVRKATGIISHLRTFGRAAAVTFEPVLLEEVIERSLSLTHEQLRLRQISVDLDISPGVVVEGNPIQLEQVFINLLTNARDALTDADERTIRISCEARAETAVVKFADTGPGIPAGLEQRIFDPFFTTKEVGTGTGLGLSITYGIIQEHGGTIAVESSAGEGARFAVELPLAPEIRGQENGA
jgi:C4-dicarboxylate-specific signal transduction histidine kinase